MLVWLSVWSEMQTCIWPSWCHCHSLSLASVKSRLILQFWYRPTRVVPDKGPLNGCVCVCVCVTYLLTRIVMPTFHWRNTVEMPKGTFTLHNGGTTMPVSSTRDNIIAFKLRGDGRRCESIGEVLDFFHIVTRHHANSTFTMDYRAYVAWLRGAV